MSNTPQFNAVYAVLAVTLGIILTVGLGTLLAFVLHHFNVNLVGG